MLRCFSSLLFRCVATGKVRFPCHVTVELQPPGIQFTSLDRRAYRAVRFLLVHTIGKTALCRQCPHVGKAFVNLLLRFADHAQLTHAGRINEQRAAGQLHQSPVGRGVPPLAVTLADCTGFHHFFAAKRVEQAGLAHAR